MKSEIVKRLRSILLAAFALSVAASPGLAADAAHGLDIAKRWCVSCHVVSPEQASASADVPPFASIAQRPNFSAAGIAYFLLDPHPKMPTLPLSRAEADDIAAYIATLRK
jgi:mono/diheme cytochrome c family protein